MSIIYLFTISTQRAASGDGWLKWFFLRRWWWCDGPCCSLFNMPPTVVSTINFQSKHLIVSNMYHLHLFWLQIKKRKAIYENDLSSVWACGAPEASNLWFSFIVCVYDCFFFDVTLHTKEISSKILRQTRWSWNMRATLIKFLIDSYIDSERVQPAATSWRAPKQIKSAFWMKNTWQHISK